MSVVIETEEGRKMILCKGADRFVAHRKGRNKQQVAQKLHCLIAVHILCSVMFERLAKIGREYETQTREHVNEYADAGLRTLVLAYRELDEKEYKDFELQFSEAKNSVTADRDDQIAAVAEKIEKDMILLGATAVEDKLQDGVSR